MYECLITGATVGVLAAVFVPRTATVWTSGTPRNPRDRWLSSLLAGSITMLVAAGLSWRHAPHSAPEAFLLAAWMVFILVGLLLAWIDVVVQRLPTRLIVGAITVIATLVCLAAVVAGQPSLLLTPMLAAAILGGGYTALVALGASQMGMGDVRLAALTGLLLGTSGWDAVILGAVLPYILALPFAVLTIYRMRSSGSHQQLPFGPFLILATAIVGLVSM